MKQSILAILVLVICSPATAEEEKPTKLLKLNPADFADSYPVYNIFTKRDGKLPQDKRPVFSPQKTREFLLSETFDTSKQYGEWKGKVIIFEASQPKWVLEAHDFKHFSAEWVTEDVIKIEVWPGRIVQLIE